MIVGSILAFHLSFPRTSCHQHVGVAWWYHFPKDYNRNHISSSWYKINDYCTLKPSSPGFSGSKSYRAMQHGCCCWGGLAGERIGDGSGDAERKTKLNFSIKLVKTIEYICKSIQRGFDMGFALRCFGVWTCGGRRR